MNRSRPFVIALLVSAFLGACSKDDSELTPSERHQRRREAELAAMKEESQKLRENDQKLREEREKKTYGHVLSDEERIAKNREVFFAHVEANQQQLQALKTAAIAIAQGKAPAPPVEAGSCQRPFFGFKPRSGNLITINPGEEPYFGYPPGIYGIDGTPGSCYLVVNDEEAKDGDKWIKARLQSEEEWYKKSKDISDAISARMSTNGTSPKQHCPSPRQKFRPHALITALSPALEQEWGLGPGTYYLDYDCTPIFAGPRTVAERGKRAVDIESKQKKDQHLTELVGGAIGALLLFLILHFIAKRATGHGLLAWLTGKAGKK